MALEKQPSFAQFNKIEDVKRASEQLAEDNKVAEAEGMKAMYSLSTPPSPTANSNENDDPSDTISGAGTNMTNPDGASDPGVSFADKKKKQDERQQKELEARRKAAEAADLDKYYKALGNWLDGVSRIVDSISKQNIGLAESIETLRSNIDLAKKTTSDKPNLQIFSILGSIKKLTCAINISNTEATDKDGNKLSLDKAAEVTAGLKKLHSEEEYKNGNFEAVKKFQQEDRNIFEQIVKHLVTDLAVVKKAKAAKAAALSHPPLPSTPPTLPVPPGAGNGAGAGAAPTETPAEKKAREKQERKDQKAAGKTARRTVLKAMIEDQLNDLDGKDFTQDNLADKAALCTAFCFAASFAINETKLLDSKNKDSKNKDSSQTQQNQFANDFKKGCKVERGTYKDTTKYKNSNKTDRHNWKAIIQGKEDCDKNYFLGTELTDNLIDRLNTECAKATEHEPENKIYAGAGIEVQEWEFDDGNGGKTSKFKIIGVSKGSPAKGKLRTGDYIEEINGNPIKNLNDLITHGRGEVGDMNTYKINGKADVISLHLTILKDKKVWDFANSFTAGVANSQANAAIARSKAVS